MKKITLLAFLFWSAFSVYSQVVLSNGSQLIISEGSEVVTNSITTEGGTIKNLGEITVLGDITNNSGILFDALSDGTISFEGSSAQEISGTSSTTLKGTVVINNANGVGLTQSQSIPDNLTFTSGKLTLNGFDLTIGANDPTGYDATKYIVSNGDGVLKRIVGNSDVVFPIGNATYNPVILNNTGGTSDTYGVKVNDAIPENFTATSHIVNRSWEISETNSGGSDLDITTQWNADDELGTFDETRSCIGVTIDDGENVSWGSGGAAVGNPYTRIITDVSTLGKFMVTDYFYGGLVVDFKVILAAAWNTTNNNMDKTLNTLNLIPLSDPYGLETTVSSIPANAVDWVKIELRDATDNTNILYNLARLIDQDGQIIEPDISNFKITEVEMGSYFVGIKHRNHNGVMTINTIDLTQNSPSFNFKANTNIYGTDAQVDLGNGNYGLRKGNLNNDGKISKVGPPNINDYTALLNVLGANSFLLNIYSDADINMDGSVRKVGPVTINDYSALLNSLGVNTMILEQLP